MTSRRSYLAPAFCVQGVYFVWHLIGLSQQGDPAAKRVRTSGKQGVRLRKYLMEDVWPLVGHKTSGGATSNGATATGAACRIYLSREATTDLAALFASPPRVSPGLGVWGKRAVVVVVWALNLRLNGRGRRSLRWTRLHLDTERAALTHAFNVREVLRRSLNFTTWVAHGLVARDNIEDLMRYEVRFMHHEDSTIQKT